jgi:hypothetical protein
MSRSPSQIAEDKSVEVPVFQNQSAPHDFRHLYFGAPFLLMGNWL